MASKFRGCLVGGAVGDCLGVKYEVYTGHSPPTNEILQNDFDNLENPDFKGKLRRFSDDTIMTRGGIISLLEKSGFDAKDLAQKFCEGYFKDTYRGYGAHVKKLFRILRESKYEGDIFQHAKAQFDGLGSFGNGGAMRIAPVALFFSNDYNEMIRVAKLNTMITHTNILGINGALLQCIAVYMALQRNPQEPLDVHEFISELIQKMGDIEEGSMPCTSEDPKPYVTRLREMERLLEKEKQGVEISNEEVETKLGNEVAALLSVPTAIYCFLRAQGEIPEINTDNPFRRTIQYAISLGGDTDTIGNMAGAIAGAYYGYDYISKNFQKHCENLDSMIELSDKLYELFDST